MTSTGFRRLLLSNANITHYLGAALLVFIALALSSFLWDVLLGSRFLLFTLAVVVSAWQGGLGPGLFATVLSIIATDFFLIEPYHRLNAMPADLIAFLIFAVVAFLISWTQEHRRELHRESRQRNDELKTLIDSLPLLVGVMSTDGILTQANRTALEIADLKEEAVMGQPFEQTYWWSHSPDAQARLRDSIQRAAQGELVRYDATIRVGDDDYRTIDFMISPMKDANGSVTQLIPAATDITDRKRKEGEMLRLTMLMEAQRRRMDSIIASVPGVVYVSYGQEDAAVQKMDFISHYAEDLFGYPLVQWQENDNFWQEVIHPEDWERATAEADNIYNSKIPGVVQFRCITEAQETIYVEAHSAAILDENGERVGTCGVVMDVSDRKQTESQLLQYTQDLRRSNEELEQFAYVASHDMQEPLRMVTSYLQLIEQRYADKLDEDANEFIAFAVDGASRMKQLINDLLFYSRVQRSKREFHPMETADALNQALDNLQLNIEDTQAIITHDELPQVTANAPQIVQLLQNLISNALKFRREGVPKIHIGVQRKRNEWLFSVADNGIGIGPEYTERIFVIFQRLHNREEYPGTGIGLSICKKIVEKHNGRIWLESEVGVGTTFYFTLPSSQHNIHA